MKNHFKHARLFLLILATIGFVGCSKDSESDSDSERIVIAPAVLTLEATDVLGGNATLNGLIEKEGTPVYSERGFVYSTQQHNLNFDASTDSTIIVPVEGQEKDFSVTISSLADDSIYYRAYAIYEKGTVYGEVMSFKPNHITSYLIPVPTQAQISGVESIVTTEAPSGLGYMYSINGMGVTISKFQKAAQNITSDTQFMIAVVNYATGAVLSYSSFVLHPMTAAQAAAGAVPAIENDVNSQKAKGCSVAIPEVTVKSTTGEIIPSIVTPIPVQVLFDNKSIEIIEIVEYTPSESADSEEQNEDVTVTNAKIKETANQLVLTMTAKEQGVTVTYKWTCDFQNDLCTRSIMEMSYPSESIARQVYESAVENLDEKEKTVYSVKGKVVTADMTEEYRGIQKSIIKKAMEAMKANAGK